MTKYCNDADFSKEGFTDGLVDLDLEDDAAFSYLGDKWRIPSRAEQDELRTKCTWEWTERNGVNGYEVTGPSGKSIFLPAAGYRYLAGYLGNGATGYYATASLHATNPCYAVYTSFTSGNVVGDNNIYRYYGLTVRPVAD